MQFNGPNGKMGQTIFYHTMKVKVGVCENASLFSSIVHLPFGVRYFLFFCIKGVKRVVETLFRYILKPALLCTIASINF